MDKVIINSYEEFEKLVGQQIGVSDWLEIPQERINQFADATLDHQWIHVDAERAKVESPYKSTIVHGYLTLSLLPHLWNEIIEVNNLKMMVNYGMDKMKFGQAVLSGQSVRLESSPPLKSRTRKRKHWKVLLHSFIILIDEADLSRFAGGSRRRRGYPASFAGFLFYSTADVGRPE